MSRENIDPNLIKLNLSHRNLKTLHCLQENDNEALHEHINQLSRVCTWLGRNLNGFDPSSQEEVRAVNAIATISNTIAVLEALEKKDILFERGTF